MCHVRHINPVKMHPERIAQNDKKLVNDLNHDGIGFSVREKIETKNNICINVFCYKNKLIFPIHNSNQKTENSMVLLIVTDENKSHYVCIKGFVRFLFHKTKNKNKKFFCKSCLKCFSSRKVLTKRKEDCLIINGEQSVRFEKGTIEFKNHFKQIPVPFKVYDDFQCNLKSAEGYESSYSKKKRKVKITFLVDLLTSLLMLMMNLVNQLLVLEVKMLLMNLLKRFLKSLNTAKK